MNKLIALMLFVSISFVSVAQPKFIIVGGDEYNWGKVKPMDSPLKATVVFRNEGTENLIIKKVRAACGCTAVKPAKDTLPPGDTTVMDVELRISGNGLFNRTVTIETNDPNKKTTTYRLVCDIVRDIIVKPSEFMSFRGDKIVAGNEAAETIFIKNNSKKNIKFYDLQVEPPDLLRLTIPNEFTLKPNEEIELTARVTPLKSGPFNAQIIIKTDNVDNPAVTIGVHGHVNQNPLLNE